MRSEEGARHELIRQQHRLLQELLEANRVARSLQDSLDKFQRDNRLEVPASFNIESLADFTLKRKRYESEMQRLGSLLSSAEKDFAKKESAVLALLPEGVPLVYEFETYGTSLTRGNYEIRKVSSGDRVSLEIRDPQT